MKRNPSPTKMRLFLFYAGCKNWRNGEKYELYLGESSNKTLLAIK
jgi:hypothetical protein